MKLLNKDNIKKGLDPKNLYHEMGQMCGPGTNCDCKNSQISNKKLSIELKEIYGRN